jgi:uncharacterized membrane protein
MLSFAADWLNLLIRWAHLIAGIGWIGTSFYFIALDRSLKRRQHMPDGVAGTAWEVHGGGFYQVEKYVVAPKSLPDDLIWFKWEAYLTWVTGFLLLVTQFYWNPAAWLIDPNVMPLAPWDAVAISVASLLAGWALYDGLCRSPIGRNDVALAAGVLVLILAASFFYTHVYSGRGALVHVGAFIGTLMAVNVFGVIIPNQKRIVAALLAGKPPDPALGAKGKQRSVHNTYLTLPVLVMMVSGHYPMLTGHPHAWLLVGLIVVGGAVLRHFLIGHEVGEPMAKIGWALPAIAACLAGALWLTAPRANPALENLAVSDDEVIALTRRHCVSCHATKPTSEAFPEPPKGLVLETLDEMRRYASLVDQQAVRTEAMPLGNETGMTRDERDKLGAWLAAQ